MMSPSRVTHTLPYYRKQPTEVLRKRSVLKFTGKHLCQSLFFNKDANLRPATLLKKRLWHRCFSVKFTKILRTPFLQNTSERLLMFWQGGSNQKETELNLCSLFSILALMNSIHLPDDSYRVIQSSYQIHY